MANKPFTYIATCKDCGSKFENRFLTIDSCIAWKTKEEANPGRISSCTSCEFKRDNEGAFQDCRNCGHELNGESVCPDCKEPVE